MLLLAVLCGWTMNIPALSLYGRKAGTFTAVTGKTTTTRHWRRAVARLHE
jgi:hypothetical protein